MNKPLLTASTLALSALAAGIAHAGDIRAFGAPDAIPGKYIVVYKDQSVVQGLGIAAHAATPAALAADHGKRFKLKVKNTFEHAIRAAVVEGSEADLKKLADDPTVAYVQADRIIRVGATQSGATWGLDRSDQANLPLNSSFSYPDSAGQGVRVYIIDTGVASHSEFSGRMAAGYNALNDGSGTGDCHGHGTHVAGTTAGTTYGLAKKATVIPVKVFGCQGNGSSSSVLGGINWVAQNATLPAVANMSLGGGADSATDQATNNLINRGVVTVVAAGNDNSNACNYSPARTPAAITVGSTTSSDGRSSFSNYGSCVDIYAPGSNIVSAGYTGGSATMSGTSMASPHVAGAAALYLAAKGNASHATVAAALVDNATNGKVTSLPSGANKLLNISFLNGSLPPDDTVTTLTNNVASSAQNYTSGQQRKYSLAVPAGATALKFVTAGSSGNVNLYVKFGSAPTTTNYDCAATGSTNAETCNIATAQAGTYHVLVAAAAASSGVTVTGSYTPGNTGGGCAGLPAWNANTYYNAGQQVSYNGRKYQAKVMIWYWAPTYTAYWTDLGAC